MWLLNTTNIELEFFHSEVDAPDYVILSHTWEEEEVTFQEMMETFQPAVTGKKGYLKIQRACELARSHLHTYLWIDTCCIDKKSSADLSEAINSMFRYYKQAKICYVYLCDVNASVKGSFPTAGTMAQFSAARWFTRGWTLQELLAPSTLLFHDRQWSRLGGLGDSSIIHENKDCADLKSAISNITGIDEDVFRGDTFISHGRLFSFSIAQRMSWAARRSTSRVEDEAYSLLGLFDINMPLLYGEGRMAFQRLQEEIIRRYSSVDHSILAWLPWTENSESQGARSPGITQGKRPLQCDDTMAGGLYSRLLSPSPFGFRHSADIVSWDAQYSEPFELVQRGIRMTAPIQFVRTEEHSQESARVALNCRYKNSPRTHLNILVEPIPRIYGTLESNMSAGNLQESEAAHEAAPSSLFCQRYDDSKDQKFLSSSIGPSAGLKRELILSKTTFEAPYADKIRISLDGNAINFAIRRMNETPDSSKSLDAFYKSAYGPIHLVRAGRVVVKFAKQKLSVSQPWGILIVKVRYYASKWLGTQLWANLHDAKSHYLPKAKRSVNQCSLCRWSLSEDFDGGPAGMKLRQWRSLPPDTRQRLLCGDKDPACLVIEAKYIAEGDEVIWCLSLREAKDGQGWSVWQQDG